MYWYWAFPLINSCLFYRLQPFCHLELFFRTLICGQNRRGNDIPPPPSPSPKDMLEIRRKTILFADLCSVSDWLSLGFELSRESNSQSETYVDISREHFGSCLKMNCLVYVRLFPRPLRYRMTTLLVLVTYRVGCDENRSLETREGGRDIYIISLLLRLFEFWVNTQCWSWGLHNLFIALSIISTLHAFVSLQVWSGSFKPWEHESLA